MREYSGRDWTPTSWDDAPMMVSFLVKADQDGMGFWALRSFWEGSVGLGGRGGKTVELLFIFE
jgi:hypothetical protein